MCSSFHVLTSFCPDSEISEIDKVLRDFEQAAARYKAKHGSCTVLIIDNTNMLVADCILLQSLQGRAKKAADECLYKVIFIASDGPAAAMRGESG